MEVRPPCFGGRQYDGLVRRILPAIAAFALVIAGVGGGLTILAARDHGGLTRTTPSAAAPASGPAGLPAGNVVVEYTRSADRETIDALAAELGAVDTPPTRAAGQALVSKRARSLDGIVARSATTTLALPDANDPRLAAFVREHLGRTDLP